MFPLIALLFATIAFGEPVTDEWWKGKEACPDKSKVEKDKFQDDETGRKFWATRCVLNGELHGNITQWWDDTEQLKLTGYWWNNEQSGNWKNYSPKGRHTSTRTYKNGKLEGPATYFNEDNTYSGEYVGGKKSGAWITKYLDGKTKLTATWRDGLKQGPATDYHPNGQKKGMGLWTADKQDDEWVFWYETGQIRLQIDWKDGIREGGITEYYENGQKRHVGFKKAGQDHGEWTRWDKDGNRTEHARYAYGEKVEDIPDPEPEPAPAPVAVAAAPAKEMRGPTNLPSVDEPVKTGMKAPNDAAVVIGIEDYAFIAEVPYAKRDANAFYDFLVYTRGVPTQNIRLIDSAASKEKIKRATAEVAQLASDDGVVWVYFAGHGAASPTNGERMLLGVDVQADMDSFEARSLKMSELQELGGQGGADVMMVMDTCYAGKGRGGDDLVAGKRFAVPSYAVAKTPKIAEWTAAGPNELSGPIDSVRHGAFTYFVIGALRGWADGELDDKPDGKVTAEEANLFVASAMRSANLTDQRPVLNAEGADSWVLSIGATEAKPTITPR